jgi:hypothetical protein
MSIRWRLQRRIFHQTFRQATIPTYHPVLVRSARKMLFSFLQDPTNYTSHFQMLVTTVHTGLVLKLIFIRFPASYILTIVYDHEPSGKDDYVFQMMQRYLELVTAGLSPFSTAIMETFPFRMFAPAIDLWSNLNESSSLTASYLVSWGHIQASVSGLPPCRSRCEGSHLSGCQGEDGESWHKSMGAELTNHK